MMNNKIYNNMAFVEDWGCTCASHGFCIGCGKMPDDKAMIRELFNIMQERDNEKMRQVYGIKAPNES